MFQMKRSKSTSWMMFIWISCFVRLLMLLSTARTACAHSRSLQQYHLKDRKDPGIYYRGKKSKLSYKNLDKDPGDDAFAEDDDMTDSSWDDPLWGKGKGSYYKGSKKASKSSSKKYDPCGRKPGKGSSSFSSFSSSGSSYDLDDGSDVYVKGGKKHHSTSESYKNSKSSKKRRRHLRKSGKGEFYPDWEDDALCSEMPSQVPGDETLGPTSTGTAVPSPPEATAFPTAPGETTSPTLPGATPFPSEMPVLAPNEPPTTLSPTITLTGVPTAESATASPTTAVEPTSQLSLSPTGIGTPSPTKSSETFAPDTNSTESPVETLSPTSGGTLVPTTGGSNVTEPSEPDSPTAPTNSNPDSRLEIEPTVPDPPSEPDIFETLSPSVMPTQASNDTEASPGTFPPANETDLQTLSQPILYWIPASAFNVTYVFLEESREPSSLEIDQLVGVTSEYMSDMLASYQLPQRSSDTNGLYSAHVQDVQVDVIAVQKGTGSILVSFGMLIG
jgi:hypothetical protein